MTISNLVAIAGMIIDVLGAVILARTFVVKRPKEVFREVSSFGTWDFAVSVGARNLLLSWLVQASEAKAGAGILAFGFALQACAQILPQTPVPRAYAYLAGILVASLLIFFALQSLFIRRAARSSHAFYSDLKAEEIPEVWKEAIAMREAELREIEAHPQRWLKLGEPLGD